MFANYCTGREDAKGAIAIAERQAAAHLSLSLARAGGGVPAPAMTSRDIETRVMADAHAQRRSGARSARRAPRGTGSRSNRDWLGFWFMLPAAAFLILFLAYPLGLGVWLSFTDARIGRAGAIHRPRELRMAVGRFSVFWLSVFNTLLYTVRRQRHQIRDRPLSGAAAQPEPAVQGDASASIVLIPFIVPTVLSAIAFWWIFDSQFSIISWSLRQIGLITTNIDFLGDPWNARWSVIFANIWRGVPFVAITLLGGTADRVAVALRGRDHRRRHAAGRCSATSPIRCSPRSSPW